MIGNAVLIMHYVTKVTVDMRIMRTCLPMELTILCGSLSVDFILELLTFVWLCVTKHLITPFEFSKLFIGAASNSQWSYHYCVWRRNTIQLLSCSITWNSFGLIKTRCWLWRLRAKTWRR